MSECHIVSVVESAGMRWLVVVVHCAAVHLYGVDLLQMKHYLAGCI